MGPGVRPSPPLSPYPPRVLRVLRFNTLPDSLLLPAPRTCALLVLEQEIAETAETAENRQIHRLHLSFPATQTGPLVRATPGRRTPPVRGRAAASEPTRVEAWNLGRDRQSPETVEEPAQVGKRD